MWQLFLQLSLEWSMDNHRKDSKKHPYSTSDYLSLESPCGKHASLGVDSFKDSELEIYVLQLSTLTRLFFCAQIMCAEHEFVPGNILSHCIQKDTVLFTERWNPESRPVWTVTFFVESPQQLRGTAGFLRWSNQPCEQRHSPGAACWPPRGSGDTVLSLYPATEKDAWWKANGGGWRRWVRVNVLGRCRTIVWSPFFPWSWRF
jgi:hypothetical protein